MLFLGCVGGRRIKFYYVLNSLYFRHVSVNNSPAKELADTTSFEVVGQAMEVDHVPVGVLMWRVHLTLRHLSVKVTRCWNNQHHT